MKLDLDDDTLILPIPLHPLLLLNTGCKFCSYKYLLFIIHSYLLLFINTSHIFTFYIFCIQPNIIRIKDTFETDNVIFIVMDLVRGGDLFDRIVEKGR